MIYTVNKRLTSLYRTRTGAARWKGVTGHPHGWLRENRGKGCLAVQVAARGAARLGAAAIAAVAPVHTQGRAGEARAAVGQLDHAEWQSSVTAAGPWKKKSWQLGWHKVTVVRWQQQHWPVGKKGLRSCLPAVFKGGLVACQTPQPVRCVSDTVGIHHWPFDVSIKGKLTCLS